MQIAHLEFQIDESILTQRTLRLRIGVGDVRVVMDRIARKLREDQPVPGFRKGAAPLTKVLVHHKKRIAVEAFDELKRAAIDQVLKQLPDASQPFLPPEVVEREKVKVLYNRPLEFAVKYMVDPSGIGKNPENPLPQQGQVIPGSQVMQNQPGAMGIPQNPNLPQAPQAPIAPKAPAAPEMPDVSMPQTDAPADTGGVGGVGGIGDGAD